MNGEIIPKIKLSENAAKLTNPGYKKVVRFYSKSTGKALADLIMLDDETVDDTKPLRIYHPEQPYKTTVLTGFYTRELLVPLFINGKQVYECPDAYASREYHRQELDTFWPEYKRMLNPQVYKVDISDKLYDLKQQLIKENAKKDDDYHAI